MSSYKTAGRLAGLAYLGVVLTGFFSIAYVPMQIFDTDDPAKMLADIRASELLFRGGIAAGFACYALFLVLLVLLFKLLEPFGRGAASLMVLFAAASVPITFLALAHQIAVIPLLAQSASTSEPTELARQAMERIAEYSAGISIATIFWGLWLLPFGYLVVKSGVIPRVLGAFLLLGCLGYLAKFFVPLLWPSIDLPDMVSLPSAIGEIGSCLWLLVMGARDGPAA